MLITIPHFKAHVASAILSDENTQTFMSMNTVVDGVKNAGNVDLISALKKVSYIKSVTPQGHSGIDEEYELCSPGILIVPFYSELFNLDVNARNCCRVTPEEVKKSYQLTAFDRQIGWSRMLDILDVFPSFLSNPTRDYVK